MPVQRRDGFLNIDKPSGMTSHDVVARVRRVLKQTGIKSRVGHAGTLDPLATGVLVVCVGSATRLSEYVMQHRKSYRAEVRLGITTTTYDAEGDIVVERDPAYITRADVENLLPQFTGDLDQLPPIYSAIKQGGRKLYELARKGQEVERQPRRVIIDSLELVDWSPPYLTLHVQCSAGTYIRSLAYDLGEALDVGAHLSGLIRTCSGAFELSDAVDLDTLQDAGSVYEQLVSPQQALADYPSIALEPEQTVELVHGRFIPRDPADTRQILMAYEKDELLAVLRADGNWWRPHKVFSSGN